MYLQPNLPGTVDQLMSTDDGFKLWQYIKSDSTQPNAVGRWVLLWDIDPGSGGGGSGGSGPDIEFSAKNGIAVSDDTTVEGGVASRKVSHLIDFDSIPAIESIVP